jgi:integrase
MRLNTPKNRGRTGGRNPRPWSTGTDHVPNHDAADDQADRETAKPRIRADGTLATNSLHDGGGLYCQVTPNANGTVTKHWICRFYLDGKDRQLSLGRFPDVWLKEARDRHTDAKRLKRDGIDPIDEKIRQRAAAAERKEAETKAAALAKARSVTFDQCAEQYIAAKRSEWHGALYEKDFRQTLRDYASPVIGATPVADVDEAAVLKVLMPIWTTKTVTATRVRNRIEQVLGWASARPREYRPLGNNPAAWANLKYSLPMPSKVAQVKNYAALRADRMRPFMAALAIDKRIAARALEFTILTAARINETQFARWREIDLERRLWTVPAARMKGHKGSRREHTVPLSEAAMAVLRALKTDATAGDDVIFLSRVGTPYSRRQLLRICQEIEPGITVHGFRSTFRDWCGDETNYPREVAEAALAHAVGDATERAYRRSDALEKRRHLMELWADFCVPRSDNVVRLPTAG